MIRDSTSPLHPSVFFHKKYHRKADEALITPYATAPERLEIAAAQQVGQNWQTRWLVRRVVILQVRLPHSSTPQICE